MSVCCVLNLLENLGELGLTLKALLQNAGDPLCPEFDVFCLYSMGLGEEGESFGGSALGPQALLSLPPLLEILLPWTPLGTVASSLGLPSSFIILPLLLQEHAPEENPAHLCLGCAISSGRGLLTIVLALLRPSVPFHPSIPPSQAHQKPLNCSHLQFLPALFLPQLLP